jgi:hypothetical protein
VFGPEAKRLQAEVWNEILAILEDKFPEIKDSVKGN